MAADNVVYQPFIIRTDYKVHPADGFVTTIIQSGSEATIQVSYWIVDGTPDAEAMQLPPEDPRHYQYRGTKTALQTAVKLRPDIALSLAMNLLGVLTSLPEAVRATYKLPGEMPKVTLPS